MASGGAMRRAAVACCLLGPARGGVDTRRALNVLFDSPLFSQLVVPQARATMVRTAEANGIPWTESLRWIRSAGAWTDAQARLPEGVAVPAYYRAPFHAYDLGNLCWEAAMEQELAGKAVGARNFPDAPDPEEAFRQAFERALLGLGAACPDGGAIVDLGCGTGTSTRRLARAWPRASEVVGVDLSPYMVAVGAKLLELEPTTRAAGSEPAAAGAGGSPSAPGATWVSSVRRDARVRLACADLCATRLPGGSFDVASLSLVLHELPPSAARAAFCEAARLLRPGGQLLISEMDFETDGYRTLRANPLLYALVRSTEPYLDAYAEYQTAGMADDLFRAGFGAVRLAAATGRHFALIATRAGDEAGPPGRRVLDDRRRETAKADTHLRTWQSKSADD